MDTAVVADVLQNSVHQADDAAFAANVFRRARVAGGVVGGDHDRVVAEIRAADRRIQLITRAILFLVIGCLAIGTTVAILFVEELFDYKLETVAAGFFLVAVALLMAGLALFLREIRIAAASLRIHEDLLELHRKI